MVSLILIFNDYIGWHYGRALGQFFRVWFNFLWFFIHFFSIPLHLKTLFSPWHRLSGGEYKRGGILSPEVFFESLIVNTLMRLVGFVARIVVIALGLIAIIASLIGGVIVFVFWIVAPLAILLVALKGLSLIIQYV
jgi:hypothetical protein